MNTAEVFIPDVEFLWKIEGTYSSRAENITIDGLVFRHGNWLRPQNLWIGGTQAEAIYDAGFTDYAEVVPGALSLNYTSNCVIKKSKFEYIGMCGVQLNQGCSNTLIEGNLFKDLTAAGIMIGNANMYINQSNYKANYVTVTNLHIIDGNSWTQEAQDIIDASGVEPEYAYLADNILSNDGNNNVFSLYEKTYAAGSFVSLGENGGSYKSMYTVIVKE